MDFSVIQKLGSEAEVREPEERVRVQLRAGQRRRGPGRERRDPHQDRRDPLLPELVGPQQEGHAPVDGKDARSSTTRTSSFVVEEIGKLAGQYGAARIVIEGHTDGSMRGQAPKSAVQELSLNRANSVKEAHRQASSDAAAEPVLDRRAWLGQARRHRRSGQPRQEPARRDQGLPGRSAGSARSRCCELFALRVSPPRTVRYLLGAGGLALLVLVWWIVTLGPVGDAARLAGRAAQPARSVRAASRSLLNERGAAAEHRRHAEARPAWLRARRCWSAFRSGSRPARGACSRRRARRSRCSAATCRWPR